MKENMRFIVGFLVAIGLLVLVIVLIVRGSSNPTPKTQLYLPDSANATSFAEYTQDGPVNAPQKHNVIRIRVSSTQASMDVIQGYESQVIRTKSYPMTMSAYDVFLFSLQHAGYTQGNNDSNLKDERGYCPLGDRYIFSFNDGSNEVMRYWRTSCGQGTFKGDFGTVQQLFQNMIPDYGQLSGNLNL